MTEKYLTVNDKRGGGAVIKKERDRKIFQGLTLAALSLFWVGYGHALYKGNGGNISSYSLMILTFSLLNIDVLMGKEKMESPLLNLLAKGNGLLFFVWALATIASVVMK